MSKSSKPTYENNLKLLYKKEIISALRKKFNKKSVMSVPKIERIVINSGIGKWIEKKDMTEKIEKDITKITGQKPVFTLSKKAISGFKIRQGQKVGLKVTLRGRKMYDFLERLIVSALPRIRDFKGIPVKNFGARGNLNIGIKEHIAFGEIDSENSDYIFSLQINIINTATEREEGVELLKAFGFPINFDER